MQNVSSLLTNHKDICPSSITFLNTHAILTLTLKNLTIVAIIVDIVKFSVWKHFRCYLAFLTGCSYKFSNTGMSSQFQITWQAMLLTMVYSSCNVNDNRNSKKENNINIGWYSRFCYQYRNRKSGITPALTIISSICRRKSVTRIKEVYRLN